MTRAGTYCECQNGGVTNTCPVYGCRRGTLVTNRADELLRAAEIADWEQVRQNSGPPCFHIEYGRFCLRSRAWDGHYYVHPFATLDKTLRAYLNHAAAEPEKPMNEPMQSYRFALQVIAAGETTDPANMAREALKAETPLYASPAQPPIPREPVGQPDSTTMIYCYVCGSTKWKAHYTDCPQGASPSAQPIAPPREPDPKVQRLLTMRPLDAQVSDFADLQDAYKALKSAGEW